jgi:ADP-heptose:LPS heptosyltransferase
MAVYYLTIAAFCESGGQIVTNKRILVIFPGALGDLVCVLPAIEALAIRHRDCSLELMAQAGLAEFAAGRTCVRAGHSIERREVALLFGSRKGVSVQAHDFFGRFLRIYSFFGSNDADFRRNLSAASSGTVVFHRFRPQNEGHICAAYLASIGERRTRSVSEISPGIIRIGARDRILAARILALHGLSYGGFTLIAPGSGSVAKNWPLHKYLELAGSIPMPSAFLLGPAEQAIRGYLANSRVPVLHDLALGTAAALLESCALYLGNDSGISHLAGAIGARGIALFGPTDPNRWCPAGKIEIIRVSPIEKLRVSEVASRAHAMIRQQT